MKAFEDFLKHSLSSKEASLVITKDEAELTELARLLEENGYNHVFDSFSLLEKISSPSKSFFVIHHSISKNIYDFIAQYPTGQIELYDSDTMRSITATPHYRGSSLVFLITKENLLEVQNKGFDILSQAGMAYQS